MAEIELRQLRLLVALTERGGLTAAAKALGMAQSTASEVLAALERIVGTRVLRRRRTASEPILTEAGLALLPHARVVLASLESTHLALAEISPQARSSLAIAANESIGTYLLAQVMPAVRLRWPKTRFAVSIAICPGVENAVLAGEADIGVFLGAGDAAGRRPQAPAAGRPVYSVLGCGIALRFFAQPQHPLVARGGRSPLPLDALADFPLFISDAGGDFHTLVRRFFASGEAPVPAFQIAGTVEGVKSGVAGDGRSVGLLPEYALRTELASGQVALIRTCPAAPRRDLLAVSSAAAARHAVVTDLLDELARLPEAHPDLS